MRVARGERRVFFSLLAARFSYLLLKSELRLESE